MSIDVPPEPMTPASAEDAALREADPRGRGIDRVGRRRRRVRPGAVSSGEFHGESLFPYPTLPTAERPKVEEAVAAVRAFADANIDPAAIDREADIPADRSSTAWPNSAFWA